jgi:hypothetical protein
MFGKQVITRFHDRVRRLLLRVRESFDEPFDPQHVHADRCELDRQRNPVELPTDLRDERRDFAVDDKLMVDGDCTIGEEVKTTDAYRIALATGRRYLDRPIEERALPRDRCSILYVVGRFDTGDFEAQIRGSQLAWTARIVSVDALCRLLAISATLGDPQDRHKIYSLLRPFEYTKVDDIINLVFAAAEAPEKITAEVDSDDAESDEPAAAPAKVHAECPRRIGESLGQPLVQKSRTQYSTADGSTNVVVAVSKEYHDKNEEGYWYAFHSYYETFLKETSAGFASFGCGSPTDVLMIPRDAFLPLLPGLHKNGARRARLLPRAHLEGGIALRVAQKQECCGGRLERLPHLDAHRIALACCSNVLASSRSPEGANAVDGWRRPPRRRRHEPRASENPSRA